jgi:hypothetical protein
LALFHPFLCFFLLDLPHCNVSSFLIYSFRVCLCLTFYLEQKQGTRLLAFERRVAFAVARVRSATALRATPSLTDSSSSSPPSSSSSSSSSSLSPSPLDRLAAQRRSADDDDGTGFSTGGADDYFDSPTNMSAAASATTTTTTTTTSEQRFDWTAAELLQSFEREVRAAHADRDAIAQVRVRGWCV